MDENAEKIVSLKEKISDLKQRIEVRRDAAKKHFECLDDVPIDVFVELCKTTMTIKELASIGEGSTIEFDKLLGEPVDIVANNRTFAKGEVVTIQGDFGVYITEVLGQEVHNERAII